MKISQAIEKIGDQINELARIVAAASDHGLTPIMTESLANALYTNANEIRILRILVQNERAHDFNVPELDKAKTKP